MLIDKLDLPENVAVIELSNVQVKEKFEYDPGYYKDDNLPSTYYTEMLLSDKNIHPSERENVYMKNCSNKVLGNGTVDAIILLREHKE